jgi:hypothetical protein
MKVTTYNNPSTTSGYGWNITTSSTDIDTNWYYGYGTSTQKPNDENPREIFNKQTSIITIDGKLVVLSYNKIYEIEKQSNKKIEELSEKEIKDILMVIEL